MNYARARNYRLYRRNDRVLDLELDGGRCLLGHDPHGLSKNYKNSISRGLYTALPAAIHARTAKLLEQLFPGFQVVILPSRVGALELLVEEMAVEIDERAFGLFEFTTPCRDGQLALWRPFAASDPQSSNIILPIIPQPGYLAPQAILYKQHAGFQPRHIPLCSPIFLHGMHYMLQLLQRAQNYGNLASVAKLEHQPGRYRESLGVNRAWFSEEQWKRFLPSSAETWARHGPYVYLKDPGGDRGRALHSSWAALKAEYPGIRVPGSVEQVIILPSLASHSEEKLIRSFFERAENLAASLKPAEEPAGRSAEEPTEEQI